MKIRNRITLWITSAGLLAALLFSLIIFLELLEQPFVLLDRELESQAHTVLAGLSPRPGQTASPQENPMLHSLERLYWFKVFDQRDNSVYASTMAHFVEIPLQEKHRHYNVQAEVSPAAATLGLGLSDKTHFRVHISRISFDGSEYLVQIAKPVEKLWEEITELTVALVIGLIFYCAALVLLAYVVAGKILTPITTINNLAREISSKTLNKRLPLGRNQDELHILSLSLNQMFDRLQFSFKRQKEFIANASHELITPLAQQRIFFDEAVQRDTLPEDFRNKLAVQSGITIRMQLLVKNLLDLSTLELNETIALQPLDLTELATSVFEEFAEIIGAADIRLTLDMAGGVRMQADREKIRRMLINLIDNAIKYNITEGREIHFSLKRRGGAIRIALANTGLPIPEDELEQVFNQFYRVEKSRSTTHGGAGLGLTMVKRIVELHHGEIVIENEFDGINRIVVTIDLPHMP